MNKYTWDFLYHVGVGRLCSSKWFKCVSKDRLSPEVISKAAGNKVRINKMISNRTAVVEFSTLPRILRIKSSDPTSWSGIIVSSRGRHSLIEEQKQSKKKKVQEVVWEVSARGRVMAAFSRYLTARNSSVAGGLLLVLYLVKYSRRAPKRTRWDGGRHQCWPVLKRRY